MTISRGKYIRVKEDIRRWITNRPDSDPVKDLSELALYTSCHIVIVCQFIQELQGDSPELTRIKTLLMNFYDISEIIE